MAETLKNEFMVNGLKAHIIKRQSGKNSFLYEIRYRKGGCKIEVSSTDIDEAKRKFIEAAKSIDTEKVRDIPTGVKIFNKTLTKKKNEKLLYLFNLNGLTAYKVATMLGYADPSRVYKWIYNKAEPNALTMLKLKEILCCSAEDILSCFAYEK